MKCEPLGDQLFTRRSNAVVSSLADSLDPCLTAVPALQLDFADAPMLFYGTSRAFALVSDNGYVAFDYTLYPYDPITFGTDDLGSPKVCTCWSLLAVLHSKLATGRGIDTGSDLTVCVSCTQAAPYYSDVNLLAQDDKYDYPGSLVFRLSEAGSADAAAAASLVHRGFSKTFAAFQPQKVLIATW